MRLTKLDLAVVRSFADRAHASKSSRHLSHDGQALHGEWMGGARIAEWVGDVVRFNDLGSKAAQTVQRALRKELLPRQVEGERSMMRNPDEGGKVLATTREDRELLLEALESLVGMLRGMLHNEPDAWDDYEQLASVRRRIKQARAFIARIETL